MKKQVNIAIDAMGGINSPKKIIEAIAISLKNNKENFFFLYGQQDKIKKEISRHKNISHYCKIINANDVILDNESPNVIITTNPTIPAIVTRLNGAFSSNRKCINQFE